MDHVEKIATRQSISQAVMTVEAATAMKSRIQKLLLSPYFGRVDFVEEGMRGPLPVYIGIHGYFDEETKRTVMFDWRAPISAMFYDFEVGPGRYRSPSGEVSGEIALKRQYRIRNGSMEFMLESSLNIMDDVLQKELSRASDEGMKNIVATIQRDQNAIIRDEHSHVLIIQGVAGSGKTSIALHRIAFLLYRFKYTLKSQDILIISPNRVFADYIANVLPELGEEEITQISMEALADELLGYKYRFQTFFEQTSFLLETHDEEMRQRVAFKASRDFLTVLDDYVAHVDNACFSAEDVWVAGRLIPSWFIDETFRKHRGIPATERIARVVAAAEHNVGIYYNQDFTTAQRGELRAAIRKMYRQATLRDTYKALFAWMERPELFKPAKGGRVEYADVFPMVYLKMRLEGVSTEYAGAKHLLVDEMQDYTPVQYAVIAQLFRCKKTILGDANQSVNPYSASKAEDIQRVFRQSAYMKLTRSYRSTVEIMRFAQGILPDPELEPIERRGTPPRVLTRESKVDKGRTLCAEIRAFLETEYNTLGVICKTQKQAEKVFGIIEKAGLDAQLLDAQSASFSQGVIVCTAHMAKGLEFDAVIVPDASARNYRTAMDRSMLYVACTRAMHELTLTCAEEPTAFIRR